MLTRHLGWWGEAPSYGGKAVEFSIKDWTSCWAVPEEAVNKIQVGLTIGLAGSMTLGDDDDDDDYLECFYDESTGIYVVLITEQGSLERIFLSKTPFEVKIKDYTR
jgi:hypothetical protein